MNRISSLSIDNMKCSILNRGDGFGLTICACYLWEIVLNVGLDVSFDNIENCKAVYEKAREVNDTKAYSYKE
jgi:hypothetical protein